MIDELPPYILTRSVFNWEDVKSPGEGADKYDCLDTYAAWQASYSAKPTYLPNWGRMSSETFCIPQTLVPRANNGKAVNNSSYAVIVTFTGTIYNHKFLFGGDLEESGWEALLNQNPRFRASVQGTTFYFVSHHGHVSGFSPELFKAMGQKPTLNLISATNCYDSHDSRYSENALGLRFGSDVHYTLTTRSHGSIFIDVDDTGLATVNSWDLPDNIKPEPPSYLSYLPALTPPPGYFR